MNVRTVAEPCGRMWLLPDERRYLQSKVKKKSCNPTFDEVHIFQVGRQDSRCAIHDRYLKLTVLDNDRGRRHNVLGHAAVGLGDVADGGSAMLWRDLERDAELGAPDRKPPGEVLLSLCYNGGLERLTVTVCEARALEPETGFGKPPLTWAIPGWIEIDFCLIIAGSFKRPKSFLGYSMVKLCFMRGNKVVKTKKTTVAKQEPKYNESFHFRLPPGEVNSASVVLQLTRVEGKAKERLCPEQCLGRVVLGSFMFTRGKALEHWNQAMAANHRQVRLWHQLT
ncbi:SYT15 [Cordylochernes scorpioides]|uniref:SYT15 n=1 Tax=Cordylochernes scorpioides TaxID=51811 RepID=A0ABY6LQN2_9ARAC|nr:SYT15 [Cordylochernes scorpioides]